MFAFSTANMVVRESKAESTAQVTTPFGGVFRGSVPPKKLRNKRIECASPSQAGPAIVFPGAGPVLTTLNQGS
jgi:hypothetical protein